MEPTRVPLPEPEYLARIGEIAYTVAYLEWTVLGDLNHLAEHLPTDITLAAVEPLEVGRIARSLKSATKTMDAGPVKDYLAAAYRAFFEAAEIRNDVLHARPATHHEQDQRLLRAATRNRETTGERFWIDNEWFDAAIRKLNELLSAVDAVRPPVA